MLEKVKAVIAEQFGVDEDKITLDTSFVDDLGADSLDTIELIIALEEEFNVRITDDEAEKIRTVKDVIDFIKTK